MGLSKGNDFPWKVWKGRKGERKAKVTSQDTYIGQTTHAAVLSRDRCARVQLGKKSRSNDPRPPAALSRWHARAGPTVYRIRILSL